MIGLTLTSLSIFTLTFQLLYNDIRLCTILTFWGVIKYIYAYKTYETSHVHTDRKDHHFYIILKKKHLSLTTNLHNQDYQHISLVLPHLTGPFVCLGWNLLPPSVKKSLMQEELADGNPKTHPRRNNLKIKLRITHLLAKTKRPLTTGIGKTVHHTVMKIEIFWKMFRRFVDYHKEFWKADKYRLTVQLSEETTENILLALTSVTSFFKINLCE